MNKPKANLETLDLSFFNHLLPLKRREVLALPKNKFQHFYAVKQGALKAYQIEANGKEVIRSFYFRGEILGYEAIAKGYYPFTVCALTDTLLYEIPYEHFLKLIHEQPALQHHCLYLISKQLNHGSYLSASTAEQRLAAFLIELASRLHPLERALAFSLPLSQQDMGSYLRLAAETISRLFSKLQKNKILTFAQKKVCILESEKLQALAEGLSILC
ncbi:MAG TPA: Crp/Fnr family transcriptional regulator [Gammaproteobacteria bacterium]|nr:Crp/Fnr family transcriptional regulator [Gammaproteobacteria bacterium]